MVAAAVVGLLLGMGATKALRQTPYLIVRVGEGWREG